MHNRFLPLAADEDDQLDEMDELGIPAAGVPESPQPLPGLRQVTKRNTQMTSMKKAYNKSKDECVKGECCHELHSLFDADLDLGSLQQERPWIKIESVMDSGAAESVAPPDLAPWIAAEESEGSKRGQTYVSASGDRLPNLGEKKLRVTTVEGHKALATYQLADVTRPLCSISKVCDRGNTVTFTAEGGFITSQSGEKTQFRRQNNVYVLDMYMRNPNGTESGRSAVFSRPSR